MVETTDPQFDGLLAVLRCPRCRSVLGTEPNSPDDVDRLACGGCGSRWPIRFGIPDLRATGVSDPYLTIDEDLRAAERLFERARTGGFADALATYYETNARVSAPQARRFIAATMAAEERARAVLATWRAWSGLETGVGRGVFLELGCGTGPLLVAAQSPNAVAIGVDVGLRWLVLAAARLRDRNATAYVACAGADHLPFTEASIDVVASESLLENVPSAAGAVAESARVLRPHGWFWMTTANRWSVGPDPHVGLPMGGWLPDRVVSTWASRHGMVPPNRRLLGARDVRRLLSAPVFDSPRIEPPPITDAQRQGASTAIRAAVDAYRVVERSAVGRAALMAVGPSLLAVARKSGARQSPPPGA